MKCAVIFGGTGFIGCFFADFLISRRGYDVVYLHDLQGLDEKPFQFRRDLIGRHGDRIRFVRGDVREEISWRPEEPVNLIANFAAVHREPGHATEEYFETNIRGAENVTAWADVVGCDEMVFTSSISPYGVSESTKDEATLPVPVTAYGSSKLVAEKIHLAWHASVASVRRLTIVRPGVVFGPGEGGNVTRLVSAVSRGYFVYMGNRNTRKAGIYVKELCEAISWAMDRQREMTTPVFLFNATMNPGPSINEYVEAVKTVSGIRGWQPNVPYRLLLLASYVIESIAKPLSIEHPFSPVRIRKLVRSNNVSPNQLTGSGYTYVYDLESAMQDWKRCCPSDWK
ncbi:NAD-dependent epimerase/dehydratase family protein [Stenotrophomonas sp.]|uniref:NAD-dependent epimerase/dehydratase family protein n=1 Tax=Stenotrophomonas sp. TaxID=69392 RepID=UPI0028ADDD23|nr:NAD-dependent epimerase/dehydratase family protein [Stenotrophomonas sp.]